MTTTNEVIATPRRRHRDFRCIAALIAALFVSAASAALIEGKTNAGHRYLAGGIGTEEVDAMRAQAPDYSLHLITAAKTGAYVAGAHIRIVGPGNDIVLDTTIDAPWLLVALPAGRYTVRATHSGDTVERRMNIAPGKAERVVLHFDAPVDGDGAPQTASPLPPRLQ
jgi:hypothetical protein